MTRETFIVMVSLALTIIAVVVIAIGLVDGGAPEEGLTVKQLCDEMFYGDNWTLGFHNQTVQKCLSLQ